MSARIRRVVLINDEDKPRWTREEVVKYYDPVELSPLLEIRRGKNSTDEDCKSETLSEAMTHPHVAFIYYYTEALTAKRQDVIQALHETLDRPMYTMGCIRPSLGGKAHICDLIHSLSVLLMSKDDGRIVDPQFLPPIGLGHFTFVMRCRVREVDRTTSIYVLQVGYRDRAKYNLFEAVELKHIAFMTMSMINSSIPRADVVYINFSIFSGALDDEGMEIYYPMPTGCAKLGFHPFKDCYVVLCALLKDYPQSVKIIATVRHYQLSAYDSLYTESGVIVGEGDRYT